MCSLLQEFDVKIEKFLFVAQGFGILVIRCYLVDDFRQGVSKKLYASICLLVFNNVLIVACRSFLR